MKRLIAVLLLAGTAVLYAAEGKKHSLVIMFDGLRADAVGNLEMPNFRAFAAGKWHPEYRALFADNCATVFDAAPSSAANHVTIATGVNAARHGVRQNGLTAKGNYQKYPPYLTRLAESGTVGDARFYFRWSEDKDIKFGTKVRLINSSDAVSVAKVVECLKQDDAPGAVMLYIDLQDGGGHAGGKVLGIDGGFYPYGDRYREYAVTVDNWLGEILAALKTRKDFSSEDWMIVLCADHGGFRKYHGGGSGVSGRTVPLAVASRNIPGSGRIAGQVSLMDIAPTVLAHHGMDVSTMGLTGKVIPAAARTAVYPQLADGLLYYLPFDRGTTINAAGKEKVTVKKQTPQLVNGKFGKAAAFTRNGGYLQLLRADAVKYRNGRELTVAFWIRTSGTADGDPPFFGNKSWRSGFYDGLVLLRKATLNKDKTLVEDVYLLNSGNSAATKRIDMGKFLPYDNEWIFMAVSCTADGSVYFVQGFPDGRMYWMCEDGSRINPVSKLPWNIGQDGAGNYSKRLDFQMDDFAFWTRGLELAELRMIFEKGRNGISLQQLLKTSCRL